MAWIAEAARRADDLTTDEAVDVARLAFTGNDPGAIRLAEMATRPRREEVTARRAAQQLAADRSAVASIPTEARLPADDYHALVDALAIDLGSTLELGDLSTDQRVATVHRLAADQVDDLLTSRESAHAARLAALVDGPDAA